MRLAPQYIGDSNEIVTKNGAIVHIIRARPNLGNLIPNIIYSIESGEYVPEDFISEAKVDAMTQLQEKLEELDEMNLTSQQKMNELINYSNDLGFLFTDLMQEISGATAEKEVSGGDKDNNESDRAQMLSNIQAYKSTKFGGRPTMRPTGMGRKSLAPGRATVAWQAVDSGMGQWMEDFEAYKPWEQDSSESREYVNSLDRRLVLNTWGAMYCGGQGPLANNLRKACKDFGISLAIESFKW